MSHDRQSETAAYAEAYAAGWRDCASLAALRIRAYEGAGADDAIRELEYMVEAGPEKQEVANAR